MSETKIILDACCGSRMFWFDKKNPNTLFIDKRSETITAKDRDKIRTIEVKPDIVADFTNLPFEDNSFYMVVFDPPHLKTLGETSWMAKKYGEENIIGFDVHLDETTAHCHATIIPVVMRTEKKTGRERPVVSYKGLFGKDKATGQEIMKQLHTELYEQVNSKYGLMRGDPVEISGAQHKDKVQMYYQLKRELPELENRAIELRIFISKLELQYNGLSHQIESLKQDLENKKITLSEYEERTSELMKQKIALGDKIRDRKSRLMQCENQIASLRQRQANAEVAVRQAANNVERMKESQLGNSVMMVKGAIFDELLSGLQIFLDNMPQPSAYALQSVQGTVVEDLFDGSLSDVISRAAAMVTAAIGDATTPMYSGGGGGSSSDDKPKKDDDEDWWRFAHRAARYASRNKPSKSATRSPRR